MLDFDIPDIDLNARPGGSEFKAVPDEKPLAINFGIIGSGQGGNRLADAFYQLGYRRVCAVNTTSQDFLGLGIPPENQLVFKNDWNGAGKDPVRGAKAAEASSEEIFNLMRHSFGEDIERIMICVGAGGGTGTGSLVPIIESAEFYMKKIGKVPKVGVVVSMPKSTEGGKVQSNAFTCLKFLEDMTKEKRLSPVVLADNDAINKMFPDASVKDFWQIANKNIISLFDIFNILACQQSQYTTFDKADYENVLDSGLIVFGATKLQNYKRDTDISDAIRNNLTRTLLADLDITKSTHAAAILCAHGDILGLLPQKAIDQSFEALSRVLKKGESNSLTIHQGVYETKKMAMFLYSMLGGLEMPKERMIQIANLGGVPL